MHSVLLQQIFSNQEMCVLYWQNGKVWMVQLSFMVVKITNEIEQEKNQKLNL